MPTKIEVKKLFITHCQKPRIQHLIEQLKINIKNTNKQQKYLVTELNFSSLYPSLIKNSTGTNTAQCSQGNINASQVKMAVI